MIPCDTEDSQCKEHVFNPPWKLVSPLVFHVYVLRKLSIFTNHMIRNSRNYISDHLATKQNKSHEMLANVMPHVTQSQNVPYKGNWEFELP